MGATILRGARRAVAVETHDHDDPLLTVHDLAITYGLGTEHPVQAVRGASFYIRAGERIAAVGESGSGKTSLGMAVAGFAPLTGATVTASHMSLGGRTVTPGKVRKTRIPLATPGVSMVFQNAMTSLDPVWSIRSQFMWALRGQAGGRRDAKALAKEWLLRVGLSDTDRVLKARPYELSGGMRQRVMVALALCGRPQLVIADEPTSALDASISRVVMALLHDLTAELGIALLTITHDIGLCRQFADRVLVMYQGEIVEDLPANDLDQQAKHPYTIGLLRCIPSFEHVDDRRLPTLGSFVAADAVIDRHLAEVTDGAA